MKMVKENSSYHMDKNGVHFVNETHEEDEQNILLMHDDDYDDDDDDDVEFKPIQRILEPRDDDQPVKCPIMPDFYFIKDCIWREQLNKNSQKRAEPLLVNEADPKKHHNSQHSSNPFQFKDSNYNIFDVFQQCKEFGFS